jgi:hypothetical protein
MFWNPARIADCVDGEDQLVYRIIGAARIVHGKLGPGFVEGTMAGRSRSNS